jgi:hypothetical protein
VSDTGPNIEEILEGVRRTVAERRASGQYPEGLEEELDAHFRRIIASRPQLPRLALFRRRIEAARRASRFSPDRIPTGSRLPGGEVLHRALARAFLREAHGILLQVQEFADRVLEALDAAATVAESPDNHKHAELIETVDAHSELLAEREKSPTRVSDRLDDLLHRVEVLEAGEDRRRWRPWFSPSRFEAAFVPGGRQRAEAAAAAIVQGFSPVLDLCATEEKCPRNPVADLTATLDGILGAVVLLQAELQVTAGELLDVIGLASDKLRADGRLVVSVGSPGPEGEHPADGEPPPPFNPTLGPPLPSLYAAFACREAGFRSVETQEWPPNGYLIVATR